MFQVCVNNIQHVLAFMSWFQILYHIFTHKKTIIKKEWFEELENVSKDFIGNIKETVDVTFAGDDDEQLEAHNRTFQN